LIGQACELAFAKPMSSHCSNLLVFINQKCKLLLVKHISCHWLNLSAFIVQTLKISVLKTLLHVQAFISQTS